MIDNRAFVCVAPGQDTVEYLNAHPELQDSGVVVVCHPQAWLMMVEFVNYAMRHQPPNQAKSILSPEVIKDAIMPKPLDPSEPPKDGAFPDWTIERGFGNLN